MELEENVQKQERTAFFDRGTGRVLCHFFDMPSLKGSPHPLLHWEWAGPNVL